MAEIWESNSTKHGPVIVAGFNHAENAGRVKKERKRLKVYLCGPINGCTDSECKDWRSEAKKVLPDTIDPMVRDYRGREDQCVKEIVELDKKDIDSCDALLVNYDKPSVGTSMEILYAWERNKQIVVVARPDAKISPWLKYHSGIVSSFQTAFDLLK